ncbi:hypothetical protein [Nocardia abscessus]|uniref:hypothetical protein n=1 Tax=Nocardia abscessus TaxID=120957 RepID=UPI0024565D97|nr:hypothetical protein [Nocardia abscessus]
MRAFEFVYADDDEMYPKLVRINGRLFYLHNAMWHTHYRNAWNNPYDIEQFQFTMDLREVPPPPPEPKRKRRTPADLRLRKPAPKPVEEDEHEDYYPEYDYLDDEY